MLHANTLKAENNWNVDVVCVQSGHTEIKMMNLNTRLIKTRVY
jgi:hypothetical protein